MSNPVSGVVEVVNGRGAFLRNPDRSFQPDRTDVFVSQQTLNQFGLTTGAVVRGASESAKQGPRLVDIESICGLKPDVFRGRTPFADLPAINPDRRFHLGNGGNPSMRIIDMFAPIGRGTRGLIDERPEEVTHFRRQVPAEVLASSSDQTTETHVRIANMCMAQARCELECGHDVVVMVDSLTRMGRAFNTHGSGSGRTMTGGLDSRALEIPRKFFGMARNVENGGSITVIASALIETGSRMDDLIFEEFKGTGNSEVVLDRALAEARAFPAINLSKTGTRRDELLYSAVEMNCINKLRRSALATTPPQAIEGLLKLLEKYPTNEDLLKSLE